MLKKIFGNLIVLFSIAVFLTVTVITIIVVRANSTLLPQETEQVTVELAPVLNYTYAQPEMLCDIRPIGFPSRYYVDRWYNDAYFGNLNINGYGVCEHGIGIYLPSKEMDATRQGAAVTVYQLDSQYSKLSFILGSDTAWCFGPPDQYGQYRLALTDENGTILFDSGSCDYMSLAKPEVDISNVQKLSVTLQQTAGSKGTLCIILGDSVLK